LLDLWAKGFRIVDWRPPSEPIQKASLSESRERARYRGRRAPELGGERRYRRVKLAGALMVEPRELAQNLQADMAQGAVSSPGQLSSSVESLGRRQDSALLMAARLEIKTLLTCSIF
jgi:hypothetical protein